MDPTTMTPLAADPDLQRSLRHFRWFAAAAALALTLLGAAAGLAGPADAAATGKDPELPVSGLTRKVNEYEGQHRLAASESGGAWEVVLLRDAEPAPRPKPTGCGSCH